MQIDTLDALSPLDGRYRSLVEGLAEKFSEKGLMKRRIKVEVEYLLTLISTVNKGMFVFGPDFVANLRQLTGFHPDWAEVIKQIEKDGYPGINGGKATNHDVQAVVLFIQFILKDLAYDSLIPLVHLPLTSEDVNNIAYGLQIADALHEDVIPAINDVHVLLRDFAYEHTSLPMLARTHGQPASPTTLGKEFNIFAMRLERELRKLEKFEILLKLNGASGNYDAQMAAFPEIDWLWFTRNFIKGFNKEGRTVKFIQNFVTAQIEPHDTYGELFDLLKRIATILVDFCQDVWRYISDDWIMQKPVEGEVGSSAMPHKVNPIAFENAEGNFIMFIAFAEVFARELPKLRLQRHLSDSTIIRNFGASFGHLLIALNSIKKGFGKISPNEIKIREVLNDHPEIISEAIQAILRREGMEDAYNVLKAKTRGKKVTLAELQTFISELDVRSEIKTRLLSITPETYIGLAPELAKRKI